MALYVPAAFRNEDRESLLGFVVARGFATLVTQGEEGLQATPLPLLLDREPAPGRLIGHLSRGNPQWRRFDPAVPALALFHGADGYVSPDWYPSKRLDGRAVPTWNYELVAVTGRMTVFEEPGRLRDLVGRLTQRHEAPRAAAGREPWAVEDAPPDYIATMLRGIVGIEITLGTIEGKRKLSQNRPDADRAGVIAGLDQEEGAALAAAMRSAGA